MLRAEMERQLESDTPRFWTFTCAFLLYTLDIVHSLRVTVTHSEGHILWYQAHRHTYDGKSLASNAKRTVALSLAKRLPFICSSSAHSPSRSGSYLLRALVHAVFGKED